MVEGGREGSRRKSDDSLLFLFYTATSVVKTVQHNHGDHALSCFTAKGELGAFNLVLVDLSVVITCAIISKCNKCPA
eukprot:7724479-Pyramimonas_sp.AAC.3